MRIFPPEEAEALFVALLRLESLENSAFTFLRARLFS